MPYTKSGYASTYRPSPARTSRAPSKFMTYSPPKSGQSGYPGTVGRSATGQQSAYPGQSYGPGMTSQWGPISRSQNPYSGYGYDQEYAGEQPMYADPSMYPADPQQEKKGCSTCCIIAIILVITAAIVGGAILIWYFCIRDTTDADKVDSGKDADQTSTSQTGNDDDNASYKFQYEEFPGNKNFIDYGGSYQHKLEAAYQKAKRSGSTEILNLNMGKVNVGEGDFIVEIEFKGDHMTQHSMTYKAGQHFWSSGRYQRSGKQRDVRRVRTTTLSGKPRTSSGTGKWYWMENNTWNPYSAAASRRIEDEYRSNRNAVFKMEAKTGGPTSVHRGIDVQIKLSGTSGTQTGLGDSRK